MKLTPRLQHIAGMIKKDSYSADVGSDHAYIPIYLIKNNVSNRAIATDVRPGPIARAEKNIGIYGLQGQIQVRQGYGLSPLNKNEVDCAVIAGMGGYLISDILEKDKEIADTIEYFVIQPTQAPEAVREYLYKNYYKINDEMLVKENDKIYQIITAEHGLDYIDDDIYFEIGKKLIYNKDPLLPELIGKKIDEINKILLILEEKESFNATERIKECQIKLGKFEEVCRCL